MSFARNLPVFGFDLHYHYHLKIICNSARNGIYLRNYLQRCKHFYRMVGSILYGRLKLDTVNDSVNLTPRSLALFIAYAKDAGNWSGMPLVGGNVADTKEDRGNLTDLKRHGLIITDTDEGNIWLSFTDKGIRFAATLGIDLSTWAR